jgi:hypothetical protein
VSENLKAAAVAAGLTPAERKKIDDFNKALAAHKELSNLPSDVANTVYNQKTPAQQAALQQNFGNEDEVTKPKRGWFGTAFHYTFGAVGNALGAAGSKTLAGLGNVSDFSTRVARTALIAGDQKLDLATAWDVANDKGDKVFSPGRIADAKAKWGQDAVDIAIRIASGEAPEEIIKSATDEQKKYLMLADTKQTVIPGYASPEDVKAARANFQDTLDSVNAAKYSPGRFVANIITFGDVEGSGLFYKAVSGTVDAAYRVLADPLLVAGKAKRAYDVGKYALNMAVGSEKVATVFSKPPVINFWNSYGAKLDEYIKAINAPSKNTEKILSIKKDLHTLAPEYGDAVISAFAKADIVDAKSAQAFFENTKQLDEIIKASPGRKRIIIPRMDPLRRARVATLTTGRKVLNIDDVGPKLVDDYWFGGSTDADGIAKTIIDGKETFVNSVKASTSAKDVRLFSTQFIQQRIDRAKAKFALAPLFKDDAFDVTAKDASSQIYRMAIMVMPKRESKLLAQAFDSIEDVGTKKGVYYGLWGTIAEVRGLNTTQPGQQIVRYLTGKSQALYGLDDAYRETGALPSDFSNFVSAPSLKDLDRAVARNTLFQKIMGVPNSRLAEQMTSAWSFLTLAGPRYAIRNAGEDLMMNIAIGKSPWGIAKNAQLSTRINTYLAAAKKVDGKVSWFDNPLGMAMRIVNRKEVNNIAVELTALKTKFDNGYKELKSLKKQLSTTKDPIDVGDLELKIKTIEYDLRGGLTDQTRVIFARTLNEGRLNRFRQKLGLDPMAKDEIALLTEQIKYGDIENSLGVVSESASNFASGAIDYVSQAQSLAKVAGVRAHALTITPSKQNLVKKPGERAFVPQALDPQDEASIFSWMSRIAYYANDDLGKIAVANLDNQKEFLTQARVWVKSKKGQQYLKDAQLKSQLSEDELLTLAFNRTKAHFVKRNGDINTDLLDKVRIIDKNGKYKVEGNLSIDDMPTNADDIPNAIVGPTLVPAVQAQEITSSVMTNGWTFLGLSNARMSRQPIVLQEMVSIRKEMRDTGFEQKWIDAHIAGIDPANKTGIAIATERAKQKLATVVEERAVGEVLQYVDNPLIRTQVAFSARNFARFYRATEDFYRRMYRVVRYNPEALVKAALTYEGVTHSGWVQKDDQGNDYFVYPGIAPVYNAVQNVLDRLGIAGEFKTPFPVEFGAQLKMLTPSLNSDSLLPTFSGPLAGASVTTITTLLGFVDEGAADTIQGYALGKYAVDRPVLSAIMPAHINRLIASMDTDERNSQYASAWRKAVTYLEASGNGLPKKYDEAGNLIPPTAAEQEAYRLSVKNTTLGILRVRFAFGFFAPASPQVQLKSDMAQWVSDNGRANWKQAFNKLLEQYPGDYDAAMAKWVELFPNQVPYTVTESERKSIAPLRYAEESGFFVEKNKQLFNDYPAAGAFLIPHKSGFSWDAYQTMRGIGLNYNKRVDDYLRDVQTAAALQTYFGRKDAFEKALENSGVDFERTELRKEFDQWKSVFFAGNPLVAEELAQGSQKANDRLRTLDELENMLAQNLNIAPKTENKLREMLKIYKTYRNERADYDAFGGPTQIVKALKEDTIIQLRKLASYNENTQAAYDVLFGRLLGD